MPKTKRRQVASSRRSAQTDSLWLAKMPSAMRDLMMAVGCALKRDMDG